MRYLYTLILYLLVPFVLVRLLYLSLRNPDYSRRWPERFGKVPFNTGRQKILWIHAVSVGEVNAARPLVDLLRKDYPDDSILMTTMTPTGADTVFYLYGDTVKHCYVPYDLPGTVRRFLKRVRPEILLVMETEIWPNLYHQCSQYGIPIVLANARMSDKSMRGYQRFGTLTAATLRQISLIAAQTRDDAVRLEQLGASPDKIRIIGNMKFDNQPELPEPEEMARRRAEFSRGRPVWIAASTHEGEERLICDAHKEILARYPDCLLIIAPRHRERFDAVDAMSRQAGFRTLRKTTGSNPAPDTQVFILDTLGELAFYYALCDLAFVGGSLKPVGGHNMLEPASLGVPVITGPYKHNFLDISDRLEACGALFIVNDQTELIIKVNQLLEDSKSRETAGAAGRQLVDSGRGSCQRLMRELPVLLGG